MANWKLKLILAVGMCIVTVVCSADTFYVTDKISIAVYPEADKSTVPLKKIPSGTLVLKVDDSTASSNGNFVQIETQDGVTGWIEAIYITNEKPTQIEYLQLAAKYNAADAKIRDYETRLLELQELRKEVKTVDWLRNQLNENKKKEDSYEHQIKLKDIALADLKITVANLEEKLGAVSPDSKINNAAASIKNNQSFTSKNYEDDMEIYTSTSSIRYYTWLVLSLAVTLIIGILLGFVLIDYKSRKKNTYAKEI